MAHLKIITTLFLLFFQIKKNSVNQPPNVKWPRMCAVALEFKYSLVKRGGCIRPAAFCHCCGGRVDQMVPKALVLELRQHKTTVSRT